MTVQIPLKGKYKVGKRTTYKGGERPAPKKHRTKIGHQKHSDLHGEQPRKHLVVDGKTGASRMEVM